MLAAVVLCSGPVASQQREPLPQVDPASVGLSAEALNSATSVLQRSVDDHKVAGAVAMMARQGKLAYVATAGYQDLSTRVPMNERTLFRIYSMTKPVTAVAAKTQVSSLWLL